MSCEECKHNGDGICQWWLLEIEGIIKNTIPNCFLPPSQTKYPLWPKQSPYSRRHIYPSAHGRCFYCGEKLKGRRRHYCSDEHTLAYGSRFYWGYVRERIYNRDHGKCVICHNTVEYFNEAEIDHIQAISLGGPHWDYDNLRTLCKKCHRRKTKNDYLQLKVNKLNATILKEVPPLDTFIGRKRSE